MSPTRVMLHFAAGVVAVVLTGAAFGVVLNDVRGGLEEFGVAVVLAGQLACWLLWPRIERCARTGKSGWLAGAALAAVVYILFALEIVAVSLVGPHAMTDIPRGFIMMLALALVFTGWLGFPIAMFVTHWAVRSRSEELRHAAV